MNKDIFGNYEKKIYEQDDGNEYILYDISIINSKTKLDLIHTKCNKHYIVDQYKFLKEHCRCQNKECISIRKSNKKIKTIDKVKQEIFDLVDSEYVLLNDNYTGTNNKMWFKHNTDYCNYEFQMTPHNFIQGNQRCPKCGQLSRENKFRLTNQDVINRIYSKWDKNEYNILSEYKNYKTHMDVLHKKCNHISKITFSGIMTRNSLCNYCKCPTRGEKRIIDFLDFIMFGEYEYQKCYDNLMGVNNGNLSYDFYIPKYNLLIEYQGEYHDGSAGNQTKEQFAIQQEHDRRKREYAKDNNIELLEIWYYEIEEIEEILQNKINEIIKEAA